MDSDSSRSNFDKHNEGNQTAESYNLDLMTTTFTEYDSVPDAAMEVRERVEIEGTATSGVRSNEKYETRIVQNCLDNATGTFHLSASPHTPMQLDPSAASRDGDYETHIASNSAQMRPIPTPPRYNRRYRECQVGQHTNSYITFFCLMCEELICPRCLVAAHLQHDVKNLEEAASLFRSKIQEKLDGAIKHSNVWTQQILKLKDLETSFQVSLDKVYQQVDKSVGDHISSVRRVGERLVEALTAARSKHFHDRTKTESTSETTSDQSTTFPLISEDSSLAKEEYHDAKSLHKQLDRNAEPIIYFDKHSYTPPKEDTTTIGRLVCTLQLEISQEIHNFDLANSVAYAQDGSILVGENVRQEVKIYQKQNGQYILNKVLKLPNNVLSVGATVDNKYLVSTPDGVSIFSACGEYISQFIDKEDAVGHLIVANEKIFGGTLGKPLITEFNSRGTPVRSITAQKEPHRFAVVDSSTIAVIYANEPGVDVINFQAQHPGRANIQRKIDVNIPLSLCFDGKSKCLLVGSCRKSVSKSGYFKLGSGVIDQYCIETGQLVGRLAEGLYSLFCMTITSDSTLIVADWKSVKLYSLRRPC